MVSLWSFHRATENGKPIEIHRQHPSNQTRHGGIPGRVPNVEFTVKAASQEANSNFLRPPNSALKSKELDGLKTRVVHV